MGDREIQDPKNRIGPVRSTAVNNREDINVGELLKKRNVIKPNPIVEALMI